MTLVVDTSIVISVLTDFTPEGDWCRNLLRSDALAAPHIMPAEVAKVLRRMTHAGDLDTSRATAAHYELMTLPVVLFPYARIGERVWELRNTVAVNDACFVALAEGLNAELATIDLRLTRAPGPSCRFLTPPPV